MDWLHLLAWVAVFGDGPVPGDLEYRPGFGQAVAQVCVSQEWAEPHLVFCDLAHARDLRERLRGAPPLWVVRVLPPEAWLDGEVEFANRHLDWLYAQQAMAGAAGACWEPWIVDAQWRKTGYHHLSMARWYLRNENEYTNRWAEARDELKAAQAILGRQAIETGVLPPVVPVERFTRR